MAGTVIALALLLATPAPEAIENRLEIELAWDAPASCPKSNDVAVDVREILGNAPVPSDVPPIVARAVLTKRESGGYWLVLRTTAGAGERERSVDVEDCEQARDLVAFLLAMLVDPRLGSSTSAEFPSETNAPEARPRATAGESVRKPERSAQSRDDSSTAITEGGMRSRPIFIASIAAVGKTGTLPGASFGGEVRAGVLFESWSLEARGAAFPARREHSETAPGAGGAFHLLEGGLVACWRFDFGPSLAACAGPSLLHMTGRGFGVSDPSRASAAWPAVLAEAAVLAELTPVFGLRGALGATVPFERPTFAIRGLGPLWRPSALAGQAALGLEARF